MTCAYWAPKSTTRTVSKSSWAFVVGTLSSRAGTWGRPLKRTGSARRHRRARVGPAGAPDGSAASDAFLADRDWRVGKRGRPGRAEVDIVVEPVGSAAIGLRRLAGTDVA